MRIVIVFNKILPNSPPDDLDTLVQVAAVSSTLSSLGVEAIQIPLTTPAEFQRRLIETAPDLIFNIVESYNGSFGECYKFIEFLESTGIPHTGTSAASLARTSNKLTAKMLLQKNNLPTPQWIDDKENSLPNNERHLYILKPVSGCGSLAIEETSVQCFSSRREVTTALQERETIFGYPFFAERLLEGKEFYVSLLQTGVDIYVAPIVELLLDNDNQNPYKIMRYTDKWVSFNQESFEKHRCFHTPPYADSYLIQMRKIALACWELFQLRGAARIDLRLDKANIPYVIDISANPALTPGSGFARALQEGGVSYPGILKHLIESAGQYSGNVI